MSQGRGVRLGLGILDKFRREILADRKREKCAFPALSILPQVELGAERVLKNLRKIDIALQRGGVKPCRQRDCAIDGAGEQTHGKRTMHGLAPCIVLF